MKNSSKRKGKIVEVEIPEHAPDSREIDNLILELRKEELSNLSEALFGKSFDITKNKV